MSNINHVISLGIGSPAAIPQFILFGLSPTDKVFGHLNGRAIAKHSFQGKATARHSLQGKVRLNPR